ncbi:unnamed protein product [Miscanthus lutarioriparius]|uniref:Very-long-chain (3R)-3-hydroxyacyl-CoA dehydratase n=1 Tax=Miscanthus lutarioriparius TaxID=422564 RepID=A0A811PFG2_9POAL|nr:unnamed protein product [Miscanthus lutarioriparius]
MAGVGSAVRRLYLSVYNWVVFFGWAQVLYYAVLTLRESGHKAVYAAVERPLQFAQTAAVMEILHGLVGLVRSPVSATLPQIGSRLFLTWGVLWSFPETQSHLLVTTLVISWSITEIIRYSFFGMKEAFGFAPSWLLWLRYSTFMLLYPTGISSEVGLIYIALPYMKASEKYCLRMPNKWNFSYDYFYTSILALLIYVPGSPHMYRYMLSQRKKALSKAKAAIILDHLVILKKNSQSHHLKATASKRVELRRGQPRVWFAMRLQVLYHAILALLGGGHEAVYDAVKLPLLFSQTAALTETQSHVFITSLVLSWSITEVIRYPFFGLREAFGITPFWLLWLRYSTFIVLYPIGLISEVGLIFTAMPHMKGRTFYICAALTTIYIPGFPYLYRYMLAQRKKNLSKRKFAGHMLGFSVGACLGGGWVKATTLKPCPSQGLPPCNSSMAGDDGSVVRQLYLSLYNWVTFFGWLEVLFHGTLALLGGSHEAVYAAVKLPLLFSQTAAIAETQSHVLVTSLVLSWSITEVIRYSFFGLKEAFGITPFWLLWLRYSTFTVLYPIGLISEVGLIFTAMPHMKGRSFYICAGLTSLYIPGFPYLYRYMLAQRKKVLSKAKTA